MLLMKFPVRFKNNNQCVVESILIDGHQYPHHTTVYRLIGNWKPGKVENELKYYYEKI